MRGVAHARHDVFCADGVQGASVPYLHAANFRPRQGGSLDSVNLKKQELRVFGRRPTKKLSLGDQKS